MIGNTSIIGNTMKNEPYRLCGRLSIQMSGIVHIGESRKSVVIGGDVHTDDRQH